MADPRSWSPKPRKSLDAAAVFSGLKEVAPNIAFKVRWDQDPNFRWDGDGPDPADEGYIAYDVTFSAKAIEDGELISGEAYLGGSYSKPGEHDPDVHGYLPQKLDEALEDLGNMDIRSETHRQQILAARKFLKDVMHARYERERRGF